MKISMIAAGTLVAVSGLAQGASSTAIVLGSTTVTQLNPASCPNHVESNVTLNPSSNVKMVFDCIANSTTIKLGTCHVNGLVKTRTQKVSCGTSTSSDPNNLTGSIVTTCNAAGTAGDGSSYNLVSGSGASFYLGNTGGGSAGASDLNGKTCDTDGTNLKGVF